VRRPKKAGPHARLSLQELQPHHVPHGELCVAQQLPGDSPDNRELEALTQVGNWESTHASKKLGILGHFVQSCFCLNTKTPKSVSSEREEINAICLTDRLTFQTPLTLPIWGLLWLLYPSFRCFWAGRSLSAPSLALSSRCLL